MGYAKLIFLAIRLQRKLAACCEIDLHLPVFYNFIRIHLSPGINFRTLWAGVGSPNGGLSEGRGEEKLHAAKQRGWAGPG